MNALVVRRTGPQALYQDLGRPGHGAEGVPVSGTVDADALRLANRLLGNAPGAVGIEVLLGGLVLEARRPAWVAVTGAAGPLTVRAASGVRPAPWCAAVRLEDGDRLELGTAELGLRYLVAVRGGFDPPKTLGSGATDGLSGLGPAPLSDGDVLPIGASCGRIPAIDSLPVTAPPRDEVLLRVRPGPRLDWFDATAWDALLRGPWRVGRDADRVGLRLDGPPLPRSRSRSLSHELPSEGVVTGAIQVPPSGPVLFLADHPVTGGYPVIAVVADPDIPLAGQLRPGQSLAFATGPTAPAPWRTVGPRFPLV